jgi:hypothetical protein
MAVTLATVQPGDIISSERWNLLLARIAELAGQIDQLSGSVSTGTVVVPSVFGLTLNQARAIITQPTQQLTMGSVINAFGEIINTSLPASASLRVINQIPVAGARTIPGAGVNLVVAATADSTGSNPSTTQPSIIDIVPSPGPVDSQVEIRGLRFASINTDNVVTFDNIPVSSPPVAGLSGVNSLFVTVPKGIPGAPTASGQANKTGVVVRVQTPNGTAVFDSYVVAPPPPEPLPTITAIAPSPAFVGGVLNVTGQNFASTAAGNQVRFDNNPALTVTPTSATTVSGGIRLAVTIPDGINGLGQVGGDRTDVPVVVIKLGGQAPVTSPVFVTRIRRA